MKMNIEQLSPADIERRSMEIIESELGDISRLSHSERLVVKRVIHATADFDYADNLRFSENAAAIGLEALKSGAVIVTDTNMALSGISKPALKALGCEAVCFMADEDVAAEAKASGMTRAAVSVDKAARLYGTGNVIFAAGNAPTALIRIHELIREGKISPSLMIGVPVGFVNVVQSKELIMSGSTPYIVAAGRKGGSTVAAAICNALLYQLYER
ncbi:MAG: precorrin-8X methylmutase [Oscillospiraceae bacterium]